MVVYRGLARVRSAGDQKFGFRVLTPGWTCCVTLDKAGLLLCLQIWGLVWKVSNTPPVPTFIIGFGCCDSVGMFRKEGSADLGLTDRPEQPKEQKECTPPQDGLGARVRCFRSTSAPPAHLCLPESLRTRQPVCRLTIQFSTLWCSQFTSLCVCVHDGTENRAQLPLRVNSVLPLRTDSWFSHGSRALPHSGSETRAFC